MPDHIDVSTDHRRAALRGSLLAQLPWQTDVSSKGLRTRFPTGNMVQEQIDAFMSALEKAGFHPARRDSTTLGPTIRLLGREAALMDQIHKDEVAGNPAPADQPQAEIKRGSGPQYPEREPP